MRRRGLGNSQIDRAVRLALQDLDQSACRLCDAVDHRPEVAAASHNIIKPHLPTRRRRWIDETWRGLPKEFEYLQTAGCRDHELAIRGQKVLTFQTLDDFGARCRGANTLRLLEAFT